ncbi:NIPSNAP family protein [Micromonospora sp. IBHARD004]|uniref:NIPSNAP family protein n=1 Tax=Micromonospora sp. IBHARD004 TaxID=3457764 RepID=UPI00405908A9
MILEIRTYRLKPGTIDEFVRLMRQEAAPLLARFGIRVVAAGASLVREDGHEEAYLIRAFPSLAVRDEREEAFYGSDAWRDGPREAILSRIESYHTVVLETAEQSVDVLRPRRS